MNFLNKFAKPQYVNTFGKSLVYQPKNYLHFPAPGHGHLAENVKNNHFINFHFYPFPK